MQAKHRTLTQNRSETIAFCSYGYPCPSHAHYPIHISIDEKSCMKTKSMLKIKNFSNRSQTNDTNDL